MKYAMESSASSEYAMLHEYSYSPRVHSDNIVYLVYSMLVIFEIMISLWKVQTYPSVNRYVNGRRVQAGR